MVAFKNITPSLNRSLSSNFWRLICRNHVKLVDGCVICTEKKIFVKNIFANNLSIVLLMRT